MRELSVTRTIGSVTIFPEGFRSDGWLRYTWSRFRVVFPGGQVTLVEPEITLRLATTKPYYEHVRVRMQSCILQLDTTGNSKKRKTADTADFSFPELNIPLKFAVYSHRFSMQIPGQGSWFSDSLELRNPDKNSVEVQLADIRGTYLPKPVGAHVSLNWSGSFVETSAEFAADLDTLTLFAETPKLKIRGIALDASFRAKEPKDWIPTQLPESTPRFYDAAGHLKTQVEFSPFQAEWQSELSLQLGTLPKLPAGSLRVQASGDHKGNGEGEFQWRGENGEEIQGSMALDETRKIQLQATIQNTYLDIGSHRLNADGQIQSATFQRDTLKASIITQSGSQIDATLVNPKDPLITFEAKVSPTEPWAISWCNGNLQIGPPARIEGEFQRGILTANVRASIPFAYKTTAEMFETDLTLSSTGIHFDNGSFLTRGIEHRFVGEVIWDSLAGQHFQFDIQQDSGGTVKVFGDFDGHISLNTSKLPTWKLPLADTTLLRGVRAVFTGNWEHRFAEQNGLLRLLVETTYKDLPIMAQIHARQNLDSLILDHLKIEASGNTLDARAVAILDSTAQSPVQLKNASVETQGFSLPALLKGIGDTTLRKGTMQGFFSWNSQLGFDGQFTVPDIEFTNIAPNFLRIQRFKLLGSGDQLQASARVKLGPDGVWDSEAEINVKGVLAKNKGLAAAIVSDNGGVLWLEGVLDSNYAWRGDVHLEGSWYLPGGAGELQGTRFASKLSLSPKDGIKGINASFQLDSTQFLFNGFSAPLSAKGSLDSGILKVDHILMQGIQGSKLEGRFGFDLAKGEIQDLAFASKIFHLDFAGTHHITLFDLTGDAHRRDQEMIVSVFLPKAEYKMTDKDYGKAYGKLDANLVYHMPLSEGPANQVLRNARIEGRVNVQRLLYDKSIAIDVGKISSYLQKASGSLKALAQKKSSKEIRKTEPTKKGRPTELDIRILDPGIDSLLVRTSVAQFPFTLDVQVQGTTDDPLLNGDINSVGKGYLGFETLADFELQSLRISWLDQAPKKGQIDLQATTEIPYCEENEEGRIDKCPVSLNVSGPLMEPNPVPTANCIVESSPAQIYYAVLILGCFPSESSSTFDVNGVGGKIVGTLASRQTNALLGGDYVGNIGLKWRFADPNSIEQRDSNYIRIPVKLDRWVKNLSFVVGYSQDLSQNPRYDQSYEAGLKYSMPVLDSGEHIPNHVDPTLDFSGSLTQRRYQATLDGSAQESRLEKNIGVAYSWRFWDYCLLGFGICPDSLGRKQ